MKAAASLDPEKMKQALEQELKKRDIDAVKMVRKYDPLLLGLFTPSPSWPPRRHTLDSIFNRLLPRVALLLVLALGLLNGTILLFFWLGTYGWLVIMLPLGVGGYRKIARGFTARAGTAKRISEAHLNWHDHCAEYFAADSPSARLRRHAAAEQAINSVRPQESPAFNKHVKSATSLAVYGCGILAAGHVGGLRALEKHGLRYENLKTLAGVSAGSVVVACAAVGYRAEELFELIMALPFHRLAMPELGSLLRIVGTCLQDITSYFFGQDVAAVFQPLAGYSGPGFNSGKALYEMVGTAIGDKTGDPNITLKDVLDRFDKRVVIIVCELDSGREVHLTPESHPFLPLRVAVRMSMGVPGLMEPFQYNGHLYCDGGMCNDFPLNALPDDGHRLGLMIRPLDWIEYHYGGVQNVLGKDAKLREELDRFPKVLEYFDEKYDSKTKAGLFSVRSPIDLALTSLNIMMDANLLLQVKGAMAKKAFGDGGVVADVTSLAPEILTLSGGRFDPFDFMMTKEQHRDLYYSGQICVHLHAAKVDPDKRHATIPVESFLQATLFLLHMDPPTR